MKLWILRPLGYNADWYGVGRWKPWYDKVFGVVVRAETEAQAREIAQERGADECRDGRFKLLDTWLDPEQTTCELLTGEGPAGLVMEDFHAA